MVRNKLCWDATFKTKEGRAGLVRVPLFWKSHCRLDFLLTRRQLSKEKICCPHVAFVNSLILVAVCFYSLYYVAFHFSQVKTGGGGGGGLRV